MNKAIKMRKWQFLAFTFGGVFYMLVYRRFLHPKSIMNSVLYHNAFNVVKQSSVVQKELGKDIIMMTCNGKIYPLLNNCHFDLVLFGSKQKGIANVHAEYKSDKN